MFVLDLIQQKILNLDIIGFQTRAQLICESSELNFGKIGFDYAENTKP